MSRRSWRLDADASSTRRVMPSGREVAALLAFREERRHPVGWFWPDPAAPRHRGGMHGRCYVLHGTGIDPGGATDQHPLVLVAVLGGEVGARRGVSDVRSYDAPDVSGIMGFGHAGGVMRGPMLALLAGGFVESVRMCLDALGFADAEIPTTREVAVASAPIESPRSARSSPARSPPSGFAWEALVNATVVGGWPSTG